MNHHFLNIHPIRDLAHRTGIFLFVLTILISCTEKTKQESPPPPKPTAFVSAADISGFPEIELSDPVFFDRDGKQEDFLTILKNSGINTIRLRLWVNPENEHSGFDEVKQFSQRLRDMEFRIWLALHYSDTWADPGHQEIPAAWQGLPYNELKSKMKEYTAMVAGQIKPEFIQIGNEINPGFLIPFGSISANAFRFKEMLTEAAAIIREQSPESKILIHYAGIEGVETFFDRLSDLDYDIIGLSYYPLWHGKDLNVLKQKLTALTGIHGKEILIAETAYPFTLGWNDWTNNIVGLEEQLILPDFQPTPEGQTAFLMAIKEVITETEKGIGFCYWGAELIAWKGPEATDASPWENQALFDFDNKALPALQVFAEE